MNDDCIIIEFKVNDTAETVIKQIKDKKYDQRFLPRLGGDIKYKGRILAVGIAYDKHTKQHECKVEVLRERL